MAAPAVAQKVSLWLWWSRRIPVAQHPALLTPPRGYTGFASSYPAETRRRPLGRADPAPLRHRHHQDTGLLLVLLLPMPAELPSSFGHSCTRKVTLPSSPHQKAGKGGAKGGGVPCPDGHAEGAVWALCCGAAGAGERGGRTSSAPERSAQRARTEASTPSLGPGFHNLLWPHLFVSMQSLL